MHGALAGAVGAACMTALRMLARRVGLIQQTVPQAVETWVQGRATLRLPPLPSQRALHHLADQGLHVGYGATFGALYGLALADTRASAPKLIAFGVGTWVFGSFLLLPSLKIMRPEWRATPQELLVNVAAHFLYAGSVGLLTEEFEQQSTFQPAQYPSSLIAKTG